MTETLFSLVVPTYNEAGNIVEFMESAHRTLGSQPHEIVVVDDDSPDQTWKIASDFAARNPWVKVVRRIGERGLSSAVLKGFEASSGGYLGVMDADLSHDEKILPKLLSELDKGADLAVGSRRIPGGGAVEWPWYRRFSSSVATGLAKVVLNLKLSDPMSGYFVMSRKLYQSCSHRLVPRGYKILVELCVKGKPARIAEIPFIFKNRKEGYSKLTGSVMRQYLHMLLVLRFDHFMQGVRYRYHTGRYKKVRAWLKSGTVLDIGCGQPCETMPDGAFLRFLGYGTGVDIKTCQPGFDFVKGSILDLPFEDKKFDNVVAMEILEHVTEPERAFQQMLRVLKDDGRIVISVPKETWLWEKIWHTWESTFGYMWNHTHTGTMSPKKWKALFSRYFVIDGHRRHWNFDLIFAMRRRHDAPSFPDTVTSNTATPSTRSGSHHPVDRHPEPLSRN